jgi:hypothetical protein
MSPDVDPNALDDGAAKLTERAREIAQEADEQQAAAEREALGEKRVRDLSLAVIKKATAATMERTERTLHHAAAAYRAWRESRGGGSDSR